MAAFARGRIILLALMMGGTVLICVGVRARAGGSRPVVAHAENPTPAPASPSPVPDHDCPHAEQLARGFAPALALAPDDEAPRTVDLLLDRATVEYRSGDGEAVESGVDASRLGDLAGHPEAFLTLPPAIDDAAAHRHIYEEAVATDHTGRYAVTAYASVHCDANTQGLGGHTIVQYWLFYFYNDGWNKHEGDWEFIQIVLGADGEPQFAAYAQHNSYTWRDWSTVLIEQRTGPDGSEEEHPHVYVARGSHASYFQYAPSGYGGDTVVDAQTFVIPRVELLPSDPAAAPARFSWLRFPGRWGEVPSGKACPVCDPGPVGPTFNSKGAKWHQPLTWGGEKLSRDDLIANDTGRITVRGRGRVQYYDAQNRHTGPLADGRFDRSAPGVAHLTRPGSDQQILLVPGLRPATGGRVEIEGGDITSVDMLIPDAGSALHIRFPAAHLSPQGRARIELGSGTPSMAIDADGDGRFEQTVAASTIERTPAPTDGG